MDIADDEAAGESPILERGPTPYSLTALHNEFYG